MNRKSNLCLWKNSMRINVRQLTSYVKNNCYILYIFTHTHTYICGYIYTHIHMYTYNMSNMTHIKNHNVNSI